jgi:hypothetical protein
MLILFALVKHGDNGVFLIITRELSRVMVYVLGILMDLKPFYGNQFVGQHLTFTMNFKFH